MIIRELWEKQRADSPPRLERFAIPDSESMRSESIQAMIVITRLPEESICQVIARDSLETKDSAPIYLGIESNPLGIAIVLPRRAMRRELYPSINPTIGFDITSKTPSQEWEDGADLS